MIHFIVRVQEMSVRAIVECAERGEDVGTKYTQVAELLYPKKAFVRLDK